MKLHPLQKWFYILGLLVLVVVVMQYASFLLIPLLYGVIFAIILHPVLTFFQRWLKYHILAFLLSIFLLITIIFIPISLVIDQIETIFSKLNTEALSIDKITSSIQRSLMDTRLSSILDLDMLKDQMDQLFSLIGKFLSALLSSGGNMLINLALAMVFSYFLSAYYRDFRSIIIKELEVKERSKWRKIAKQAPAIIRSYLSGMLIVMAVLAILNGIALYIIGLPHAFTWGLIIGLLAIIPYAGTFMGLMLPLIYSFILTNDYKQPLAILISYFIIQQLEGNLLTPKIVGDKLKVNPFVIIIMILAFGKIWGLDGVIISLPLIGVVKAILEEYEGGQVIAKIISSKEIMDESAVK